MGFHSRLAWRCILAAGVSVALSLPAAFAQTAQTKPSAPAPARDVIGAPAAATASLSGSVVSADTGRPVRRARVTLTGPDLRGGKSATTDERGRFAFTGLPAGPVTLSASKPGYLDVSFGQTRPGTGRPGTPIQVGAGQRLERLSLTMPRGGVITGTVLDELGDPALGTQVRAMRYVMRTGERTLQSAGAAQTDDRGIYRIASLPPGDYIVSATPRDVSPEGIADDMKIKVEQLMSEAARAGTAPDQAVSEAKALAARAEVLAADDGRTATEGYAPIYYPGTTQSGAALVVTLDVSQERSGVDMQLQIVPLTRITGQVSNPEGLIPRAQITLIESGQPLPGLGTRSTRSGPDGRFSLNGVAPGEYIVIAEPLVLVVAQKDAVISAKDAVAENIQTLWAMADVSVDGRNVSNVTLTLQRGMAISGSVAFEGTATHPPLDVMRLRMSISSAGSGFPGKLSFGAPVAPDGRFTIPSVAPGKYRLVASGVPSGWSLRSAMNGAQDVLDVPIVVKAGEDVSGLVVTLRDRMAEVSGTLQNPAGHPTADYTVVLFAADGRYWTPQSRRVQTVRPATDGRFTLRDLPAGDYRLGAVTDAEPGQWYDPAFLRQLFGASTALTLGEGESRNLELRTKN